MIKEGPYTLEEGSLDLRRESLPAREAAGFIVLLDEKLAELHAMIKSPTSSEHCKELCQFAHHVLSDIRRLAVS